MTYGAIISHFKLQHRSTILPSLGTVPLLTYFLYWHIVFHKSQSSHKDEYLTNLINIFKSQGMWLWPSSPFQAKSSWVKTKICGVLGNLRWMWNDRSPEEGLFITLSIFSVNYPLHDKQLPSPETIIYASSNDVWLRITKHFHVRQLSTISCIVDNCHI